ncbi:MAG TPA: inorganic phosphate transporter, partial [Stenomitos sp.]
MGDGWLALVVGLAFCLAWNLGANDVANAMGTSVGSKAITLRQAILLAGLLELVGAICFGQEVTATLTAKILPLQAFAGQPTLFTLSIVAQLLATSLWLFWATWRGWPVASSHAAVGAIAGVTVLAFGWEAFDGRTLGTVAIGWLLTPLLSGAVAALFYKCLQRFVLDTPLPLGQWQYWRLWASVGVVSLVGGLVLPTAVEPLATVLSWPSQNVAIGVGLMGVGGLAYWTSPSPQIPLPSGEIPFPSDVDSTERDTTAERDAIERQLAKFQVVSACCMAFAHGANDVGNAIAPLASFAAFWQTQSVPVGRVVVPLWTLMLGGVGIVAGLATLGKRVIVTVGEQLMALKPSDGFCAEIAAAATVLLASRLGLPVSTTHALIGSVVGISLVKGGGASLQWQTVRQIVAAWFITVPAAMAGAA